VPLLVVLRLNFAFFSASPVLFIGKSLLCKTGRGSLWQAIVIACRAFGYWCFFLVSLSLLTSEFFLSSAKRKNRAFVTVLVLCRCFLLGFFIRAVLRNKFIELGYSCLKFRAWLSFSLCFKG